jgi:hypothetical protein
MRSTEGSPSTLSEESRIRDPLAVKILDDSVLHGDHVVVTAGRNGLEFVVKRPADRVEEPVEV